jgi:hypothetical protein
MVRGFVEDGWLTRLLCLRVPPALDLLVQILCFTNSQKVARYDATESTDTRDYNHAVPSPFAMPAHARF